MLRRLMISLTLAAGLLLLAPTSEAEARHRQGSNWSWSNWSWSSWSWSSWSWEGSGSWDKTRWDSGGSRSGVPELDPSGSGSALVLLLGGVAYIASRRREEEDAA